MSDVFSAIADPTRRVILEQLAKGEKTVGELVSITGEGQPTISKHLKTLREAELVLVTAQGQSRKYSLATGGFTEVALWISKVAPNAESATVQVAAEVASDLDAKFKEVLGDAGAQVGSWLAAGATWLGNQVQDKLSSADIDAKKLGRELGRQLAEAKSGALDFAGEKEEQLRESLTEVTAKVTKAVKDVIPGKGAAAEAPANAKTSSAKSAKSTTLVDDDEEF